MQCLSEVYICARTTTARNRRHAEKHNEQDPKLRRPIDLRVMMSPYAYGQAYVCVCVCVCIFVHVCMERCGSGGGMCGMRAKNQQIYDVQSEVICTHSDLILVSNLA